MSAGSWPYPTRHRGSIDHAAREHFVYWIYDDGGVCLYIGRTCQPERRWDQHRQTNPEMACRAASFRMAGPYTIGVASRIELEQQRIFKPPYGCGRTRRVSVRKLITAAMVALALAGCQPPQPPEPTRSPEQIRADLTGMLMPPTQPQPAAPCLPIEDVMGWNGCPPAGGIDR